MTLKGNIFGGSGIFHSAIFGGSGGAAGNGLLNNLIAYWPGNEAAGNALDLHTNALHLTDTNTVTSAAGLVYAGARRYTRVNLEYHTRAGDDVLLSAGDTDFTLASWVRADSLPGAGTFMAISGKGDFVLGANHEYALYWRGTSARFRWYVRGGGADGIVDFTTLGLPVINTWYLLIAWHDSVANTLNVQANDGAVNSLAWANGAMDTAQPFRVGATNAVGYYWDGRIGPTMFWKSAGGGGGCLSAAQRTALFNAGAGLTYAAFTV